MCQSSQTKTVNKRRNREWRPTQTRKERIYIIRHIPTPRFDGPETKTPPASHPPNKTTEHPPLPLARLSNTDDASGKKSLVVFFFILPRRNSSAVLNASTLRRCAVTGKRLRLDEVYSAHAVSLTSRKLASICFVFL